MTKLPPDWQKSRGDERAAMVARQIQARGIASVRVLDAMRQVPRHCFVPEGLQSQAYSDWPLPIGEGQTISQPYIVALMTELADPPADGSVLEIGTGSGYQAAVLAGLCRTVHTLEIVPQHAAAAAKRLQELGCAGVTVHCADGHAGWSAGAPYDAIVVTAAPEQIPAALPAQLKPGGRLVVPVGPAFDSQMLVRITRQADGRLVREDVLPVRFVPFTGKPA